MSIKLVLFDYDQTLASIHLYHHLDSMLTKDPYEGVSSEEEGQRRHIAEQMRIFREQYPTTESIAPVYGGEARRKKLAAFLGELKQRGASLVIVSHGFTDVVGTASRIGQLPEFSCVIGCDHHLAVQSDCDKHVIAKKLQAQFSVRPEECVLVDDDYRNLLPARDTCPTLWVYKRLGIGAYEMSKIKAAVRSQEKKNPACTHVDPMATDALYSPSKCVELPEELAEVADGYFVMRNVNSVASAVTKCNAVPHALRIESVRVVKTPKASGPGSSYYALYATDSDAARFEEMLRHLAPGSHPPSADALFPPPPAADHHCNGGCDGGRHEGQARSQSQEDSEPEPNGAPPPQPSLLRRVEDSASGEMEIRASGGRIYRLLRDIKAEPLVKIKRIQTYIDERQRPQIALVLCKQE